MTDTGEFGIIPLDRRQVVREQDALRRFLLSLQEERYTFGLCEDALLRAEALHVLMDSGGHWVGLGGWRRQWGVRVFFLVIHRDQQRQGLGKRLTRSVVATLPPWALLLLQVARGNTQARKLYADAGFVTLYRGKMDVLMAYRNTAYHLSRPVLLLIVRLRAIMRVKR
jgi:ribosomal protein S18 acetylase RimI-like enzyme